MARPEPERGQVLVLFAILLVVLLAFAGISIDIGRQVAERRHVQNAADAAALAACRSLIGGESDGAAAQTARSVAGINLQGSPAAATAIIADDTSRAYEDGRAGDPAYLSSGIIISGTSVRVAVSSTVTTTLARVVGINQLGTGARARCQLQGGPAVPIVARRYLNAPGPGGDFADNLATAASSGTGQVDPTDVLGYNGRTPASETQPGGEFDLYGPGAKASNSSDFRGFIALDVRNFQDSASRIYYNGVTSGTTVSTLKTRQGDYLLSGYPGPMFPPVVNPSDPNDQVAVMSGNDSSMVVGNFGDTYEVGRRVLLAIYNGTVMEIPDFSITPPAAFVLDGTTTAPVDGPSFTISRNASFNSTVTLHLHGDLDAAGSGHPEYDILPDPPASPPASGDMNQPTWSTDVFIPDTNGTRVDTSAIQTNGVPAGIYTVWLEGHSGNPYFQTRRVPVPVRIGAAMRDFSLRNSTTTGVAAALGDAISLPIYVSTTTNSSKWNSGNAVSLSWDANSFTDCSLNPKAIGVGQINLSASSTVPSASGSGALSNLSISTVGLNAGCYRFNVRATGTNGDNQPVTHLQPITFSVATSSSSGSYVDIIGFAVFKITWLDSNTIRGEAVTRAYADPNAQELRRAQQPRLVPW